MKRNLLLVIGCICFLALVSRNVSAGDIVRPPNDLKSLIGKTVTLKQIGGPATFFCRITGVSNYPNSMGRRVALSVSGLNYYGEPVNFISYEISVSPSIEIWRISFYKKEISVISIE